MMELKTANFGTLTIDQHRILSFPQGLPGFEDSHRFVLLQRPEEAPISWLQSIDEPNLALAVVEPGYFVEDYGPQVGKGELAQLQLRSVDQALVVTILVLNSDPRQITANLQAPVLINQEAKLGAQIVLGDQWPRRYYLFQDQQKAVSG